MIQLLKKLIAAPSTSRDEERTSVIIFDWLKAHGADPQRIKNNVWSLAAPYDAAKPVVLLNSHHDTVRPAASYTRDPYAPTEEDGRIYGLGSNDAGASVVTLCRAFVDLMPQACALPFNLLLAITAEEEVGGENGMRAFLPEMERLGIDIDCAIVGEPTCMQPAIAERGLVVLDGMTVGVSGHAARGEGVNAIYRAIADIDALRAYRFEKVSDVLGPVTLNITQIQAGTQHNVIPDMCKWVVDVRTTDAYSNEETAEMLQRVAVNSTLVPRSTRVKASVISEQHPLVKAAVALGGRPFVSPTTSDMSLMHNFPSLKIGPGDSARSHKADEYVEVSELEAALPFYKQLITSLSI